MTGKNGPQLSGRIRELRPAGLDGAFVEQASWFEALQGGAPLTGQQKAVLRPERADTVTVYRMVQSGAVSADDSLGLFAAVGGGKAGKALVSLEALRQLGLVEARAPCRTAAAAGPRCPQPKSRIWPARRSCGNWRSERLWNNAISPMKT